MGDTTIIDPAAKGAFRLETWSDKGTRILAVEPKTGATLAESADALRELARTQLPLVGGLLLRGFEEASPESFRALVASLSGDGLLQYDYASTPRTKIEEGVYSSTEYPADQRIPPHNEQSYTTVWPMKIAFFCDVAAASGGATPITDSRTMYRRITPAVRERFARNGLRYVRNFGNGIDLTWQQVFRTEDKAEVEGFCRERRIAYAWLDDERLRTWQTCQSEARHPATGEVVWFNQAHIFHISGLPAEVQEALLEVVDEADLPRNVYFGDGEPIEASMLDEIRSHYDDATMRFPWQRGDVMLLDNMLVAHARESFEGPRRVLAAMAEPYGTGQQA